MLTAQNFVTLLNGVHHYRNIHGNTLIPKSFVVPAKDSSWPTDLWGLPLGKLAENARNRYRHGRLSEQEVAQLNLADFAWIFNEYKWRRQIIPALITYRTRKGNMLVPRNFVVPCDNEWPRACWGRSLGKTVNNIRSRRNELNDEQRQTLNQIGFIWGVNDDWENTSHHTSAEIELRNQLLPRHDEFNNEPLALHRPVSNMQHSLSKQNNTYDSAILALRVFKDIHGHSNVSPKFMIPSTPPWPRNCWGMFLGQILCDIRNGFFKDLSDQNAIELESMLSPKQSNEASQNEVYLSPINLPYEQGAACEGQMELSSEIQEYKFPRKRCSLNNYDGNNSKSSRQKLDDTNFTLDLHVLKEHDSLPSTYCL